MNKINWLIRPARRAFEELAWQARLTSQQHEYLQYQAYFKNSSIRQADLLSWLDERLHDQADSSSQLHRVNGVLE